ncbi:asparaginase [Saccharospirillum salsuginis]|uniref:Asparaginase n=1 Tax=Saccharospirillum salsuginis TaxID=418750 RepID=A0A918NEJ2_9GAMM|nr:asparaginase [Saccharospirillum salsuginis]GGX66841.1 asparaginase [Saccharospirillum salsuginis]
MTLANPTLVELTRADAVESEHRGRAVVMRSTGETIWSIGDTDRLTYPRSAIKAFQALPMVASGAPKAFGLDDIDLALTCASHEGEARHTEKVIEFLTKLGLSLTDLECGYHWPMGERATVDLAWSHHRPDARHNNCSGKHAGMLALARQEEWDHHGYSKADHPVQQAIRVCIERCCDTDLVHAPVSPDGCTAPTWAMPLHRLALGFARFADPHRLPTEFLEPAQALYSAATRNPFYVAGTGRYCTRMMMALNGRAFLKVGAEGVYIAALPEWKLGIALKMDSGSALAAEVAMSEILHRLGLPISPEERQPAIRNRNRIVTGEIRAVGSAFADIPNPD